jgi:hypothetical protein
MAGDIARIVAGGNQMLLLDYDTGNRAVFGNGTKVYIGANNTKQPDKELVVDGDISGSSTGTGSFGRLESNTFNATTFTSTEVTSTNLTVTGTITGSSLDVSGDGTFGGNIRAVGDVVAERYIVSSSVTHLTQSFSSGSTIFGDTIDDTHKVTGSMTITGSLGVNRVVSGRGDVEIAGEYHDFPSGNGQLAILSNISASNASGSDQGGQIVFGGPISDSDLTRTFGLIGGLKENSTDGNRAGYVGLELLMMETK